jgi:hypothetical protein
MIPVAGRRTPTAVEVGVHLEPAEAVGLRIGRRTHGPDRGAGSDRTEGSLALSARSTHAMITCRPFCMSPRLCSWIQRYG